MQSSSSQDYQAVLTEVIKKQIAILGPQITLSKARGVAGLTIDDSGTVTNLVGDPQVVMQALVDQFVQLSGLIVRKTMEPLLMYHTNPSTPPPPVPSNPEIHTEPVVNKDASPYVVPSMPPVPHLTNEIAQAEATPILDNPSPNAPELNKGPKTEEIQRIIDEALKNK